MHGEILYGLSRTFFCFDECVVWDEYYKNLCIEMRADPSQFCIEVPEGLLYHDEPHCTISATYYFQGQTGEQMLAIREALDRLGTSYRVRPHPIYTDMNKLRAVFKEEVIEDCNHVSIEQSIMESEMIIAKNSTVLFQGYINNRRVVIDDISDPHLISQMRDSGYIMLNKSECDLLSDVLASAA